VGPRGRSGHWTAAAVSGKITIICDDRRHVERDDALISDNNTNIRAVETRRSENDEAIVEFVGGGGRHHHLNRMVLGLRRVAGVRAVQRTQKL